jgi:predicted ATP-grasp superfamily ATP-dependent carboligase
VNEQLLGLSEAYQEEPFGYCGNIVPLDIPDSTLTGCDAIVKKVSASFKLRGSNGIDIVISEEGISHVIEVNPRFQGSLECVERVLGMNLVEIHVEASTTGGIPPILSHSSGFSIRLIMYAPRRLSAPNLASEVWARDIPFPGSIVEKGEPLCSVFVGGESRSDAWKKALVKTQHVYDSSG